MPRAFRLQKVLNYRQLREQEQRATAARAQREATAAQADLDGERARLQAEQRRARATAPGRMDLAETEQAQAYRELLERRIGERADTSEARRHEQERANADLLVRRQERRALEKLRERHEAARATADQRREAAFMDEITASREGRRMRQ